jgi:hypothetical protein
MGLIEPRDTKNGKVIIGTAPAAGMLETETPSTCLANAKGINHARHHAPASSILLLDCLCFRRFSKRFYLRLIHASKRPS